MKSTKFKTKTEKGITLIALIITIVVLMILAAVAINSITNEGILEHAGSTANKYNQAVKDEESYLQDYEDMLTAANGGYKDKNFNVGDTVKVGTEEFYVIEDKTAQGKVVLLAKKCIDITNLVQSSASSEVIFSTENYWKASGDIKETLPIPEDHYAARAAYDYGAKIGGNGRLMTYTEASVLKGKNEAIIFGTEADGYLSYWLGTGSDDMTTVVYTVVSDSDAMDSWASAGLDMNTADGQPLGVRPVVEISKSKLS